MKHTALADPGSTLLFDWGHGRSRKLSMTACIVASVAAHALCFYVFQIVYPPTVALLPPPARVSVITPESEEGRVLLSWIEAEDPALVSTTQRPPESKAYALPKIEHVPSYLTTEPALKPMPAAAPDLSVPSSQPPGPVKIRPAPRATPAPPTPSLVQFGREFDVLGSLQKPDLKFVPSTKEAPENVRFLVGANGMGEVHYVFLQRSSGDQALDEQARQVVMHCRFSPAADGRGIAPENLVWGDAVIEWGNDIVPPSGPSGRP